MAGGTSVENEHRGALIGAAPAAAALAAGACVLASALELFQLPDWVEIIFAWPGLGSTIVQSILNKDYPLVQAIVLVYGVGVLLTNTAVDVALAALDPRSMIREG